jgi:hypothetical protein
MTDLASLDRKVEADLEGQFIRLVAGLAPAARIRKASWIGQRGATDRVVFLPGGRSVWVELKNGARGRVSGPQRDEIRALRELNFNVWLIHTLDDLREFGAWFRAYL